jgi:hypothetical protein
MKPVSVGLIDSRHMFKNKREKICNNQKRDPLLDELVVIAFDFAIEEPIKEPASKGSGST